MLAEEDSSTTFWIQGLRRNDRVCWASVWVDRSFTLKGQVALWHLARMNINSTVLPASVAY